MKLEDSEYPAHATASGKTLYVTHVVAENLVEERWLYWASPTSYASEESPAAARSLAVGRVKAVIAEMKAGVALLEATVAAWEAPEAGVDHP